jgi:PST family polysaccharide transporter
MFFSKANRLVVRNLFRFSAMGITSALMVPLSLLLIRNIIIKVVSPEAAGYWEAMTRISSNYLMMVTTTLAIYYLPRLSETLDFKEVRNEIFKGYKLIMPLVILIATTIYLFRFVIIKILFSHQFGPMEPLFLFQLLGDIIKIASWLLAFVMLAKAMARMFIITEIIFNLTYVLLSYLFIHRYGLVGATYAYATNYLLYLITCYLLIRRKFAW